MIKLAHDGLEAHVQIAHRRVCDGITHVGAGSGLALTVEVAQFFRDNIGDM